MNRRKGFSVIVTTVLMLLLLHINIIALPMNFNPDDNRSVMEYVVNPLYQGYSFSKTPQPYFGRGPVSSYAVRPTFDSKQDAVSYVRSQMKAHVETIEFVYSGTEGMMDILDEVYKHTGVPDEGENLMSCWNSCRYTDPSHGASYYGLYLNYVTTIEQDLELQAKITATLASLHLDGMSEFEKIETIYSWISTHVEYDHESADQMQSGLPASNPYNQTAYGAMCLGSSVCNGYALLCYRMMLESGIDCRYVSGKMAGVDHAWNIIKCDGTFYFADVTNDAADLLYKKEHIKTYPSGWCLYACNTYNHFLKGKTITSAYSPEDYVWDEEYCSPEFFAECPVSDVDYTGHHVHSFEVDSSKGYTQEPTCTEPGFIDVKCSCGQTVEGGAIVSPYGHSYGSDGNCIRCGMRDPSLPADPDDPVGPVDPEDPEIPMGEGLDISSMVGKNIDDIYAAFKGAFPEKEVISEYVTPPDYTITVALNEHEHYEEGIIADVSMNNSACKGLDIGTYLSYNTSDVPNPVPEVFLMECLKGYSNVTLCYGIPVAITMDELEKALTSKGIKYTKEEKSPADSPDSKSVVITPAHESMPNGYLISCCWKYDSYSRELTGVSAVLMTYIPGDVNNDGDVTLDDAILTLKKAMNVDIGSETFIAEAAEVTGDGQLSLEDAIGVLKKAMGVN